MLNQQQLATLQGYAESADPIGYYTALKSYGVGYASLALGFATAANSNNWIADLGSTYAMKYFDEKFRQFNGRLPTVQEVQELKVALMRADYDRRKDTLDGVLSVEAIAAYHREVYTGLGIPISSWTGNTLSEQLTSSPP